MSLDAPHLVRLQVELEYQVNPAGHLLPFPGSDEQAKFIVYRTAQDFERFFRHDLPETTRTALIEADPARIFDDPSAILSILGSGKPAGGIPVFSSGVLLAVPDQVADIQAVYRDQMWVIDLAGETAAYAWSVRQNDASAELAVEVETGYRRRGFGRQLAAAWARQVLESGRVAFYSYRLDNLPSMALARSLSVVEFARCIAFD